MVNKGSDCFYSNLSIGNDGNSIHVGTIKWLYGKAIVLTQETKGVFNVNENMFEYPYR